MKNPSLVSIIMGSQSDWATMKHASKILKLFNIKHEVKIISAHRTPKRMFEYAERAEQRGIEIIIAGAGGAAHLPGMTASISNIPVLGVPIESKKLKGLDSLLSIAQMPAGVPVGTLAVGEAGAKNAALLAVSILSSNNTKLKKKYASWRSKQTKSVKNIPK
jgi:5-(carboxyamino)imidazole ribonucleotide mutase